MAKYKVLGTTYDEAWLCSVNQGDIKYRPYAKNAFDYHESDEKETERLLKKWGYTFEKVEPKRKGK